MSIRGHQPGPGGNCSHANTVALRSDLDSAESGHLDGQRDLDDDLSLKGFILPFTGQQKVADQHESPGACSIAQELQRSLVFVGQIAEVGCNLWGQDVWGQQEPEHVWACPS